MDEVKQYAELENRRAALKDELTAIESNLRDLEPAVLEWFQVNGTQRIALDGRTLYLNRALWAGRVEGVENDAACEALKLAGYADLCGIRYNTQTLSALFREREKDGQEPVPSELQGSFVANEKFTIGSRRN